jgi:hypothetical protein
MVEPSRHASLALRPHRSRPIPLTRDHLYGHLTLELLVPAEPNNPITPCTQAVPQEITPEDIDTIPVLCALCAVR